MAYCSSDYVYYEFIKRRLVLFFSLDTVGALKLVLIPPLGHQHLIKCVFFNTEDVINKLILLPIQFLHLSSTLLLLVLMYLYCQKM